MRSLLHAAYAAAVVAGLAGLASGQDLGIKAAPQTGTICLYNAAIHPIVGDDIANGFIVFSEGVITQIGSGTPGPADAAGGAGYTSFDCGGGHIYPGLIAPWTQLGLTEIQAVQQTWDTIELGGVTPEVCPATAVNPDSTLLPITRSNGVLIAAVAPLGGPLPGQVSIIRLDGWTTDDLTIVRRSGQVLRWPNMRTFTFPGMVTSEDDQRKEAREAVQVIERVFDTVSAYQMSRITDRTSPIDLRWEAMGGVVPVRAFEGHDGDLGNQEAPAEAVFVRASDAEQINAAVTFGKARGLRMVIVGGREADRCAELLKAENVPVIVMGTHNMPSRDDAAYDSAFTLPARLAAAGVMFTIANADDTAHERNTPYTVATAVKHGLDHEHGLRSLTIDAATILGIEKMYGSLEKGKRASIIITTGDPMEVRTQITAAYIDGRKIDLSNKQTELARKYRERLRQIAE